jgi:phytoene dehydrogenase-like protein
VHLGGSFDEIARSERDSWEGRGPGGRPFVILAQQSLFDPSRAPEGKQTAWAYCHVPSGWEGDATDAIEAQVERAAPGFRDLILARPELRLLPWRTPLRGVYLCSASTPPGGGVHGLCGLAAARVALRDVGSAP